MQFIIYPILLIGVLVFIHEFGHYFFAKYFKVKVERFAIGMGPVIRFLSFTRGETEYTICLLPIGGYVKMFGMAPEELYDEYGQPLPEEEAERAFVRKPLWQRAIIVLAGPLTNLIFPVFIYFFFALGTSTLPPASVGQVVPQSPAAAAKALEGNHADGLQPGDLIVSIDNEPIRYWNDLTDHVRGSIDVPLRVEIQRGPKTLLYEIRPKAHTETDRLGLMRETYGLIGVSPDSYGPILGIHDPDAPAAKAGLQSFDRIVSVNKTPVKRFVDIQHILDKIEKGPVEIVATRPKDVELLDGGLQFGDPMSFTVTPVKTDGRWSIGARSAGMFLSSVEKDSPAAKAGLQVGDEILQADGQEYNKSGLLRLDIQQRFWEAMNEDPDKPVTEIQIPITLKIQRGNEVKTLTYAPLVREIRGEFNEPEPRIWFGFDTRQLYELPDAIPVPWSDRVPMAVETGFEKTYRFTRMLFNGVLHMFSGRVSTDSLGGPLMIGHIAAKAGQAGWEPFLRMMAIISINLGILNLLPIPVLDGGHLMLFALEGIKRKELTQRTRQIAYYAGFSIIAFLMLLAFKNDIERYWQNFAEFFNG